MATKSARSKKTFTVSPGPSQLFPEVRKDIVHAVDTGVLELSHRSKEFTEISHHTVFQLRKLFSVPDDYHVLYLDSASTAWHSIVANCVEKKSFHFSHGAFSAKAKEASKFLYKETLGVDVPWGEAPGVTATIPLEAELITICLNETSTGVKVLSEELKTLRVLQPQALLAVDITSCGGAVPTHIPDADMWYFSVQKCFGLPAGLGVLILSPRAYQRSLVLMERKTNLAGEWAWKHLVEMMQNGVCQTPQTPNVLNIFLLGRQAERFNALGGLPALTEMTIKKKLFFEAWMQKHPQYTWFAQDPVHRSDTVFAVATTPELVIQAHEKCLASGITLGAGYGKAKTNTFRIANFPAITMQHLTALTKVLS